MIFPQEIFNVILDNFFHEAEKTRNVAEVCVSYLEHFQIDEYKSLSFKKNQKYYFEKLKIKYSVFQDFITWSSDNNVPCI